MATAETRHLIEYEQKLIRQRLLGRLKHVDHFLHGHVAVEPPSNLTSAPEQDKWQVIGETQLHERSQDTSALLPIWTGYARTYSRHSPGCWGR